MQLLIICLSTHMYIIIFTETNKKTFVLEEINAYLHKNLIFN